MHTAAIIIAYNTAAAIFCHLIIARLLAIPPLVVEVGGLLHLFS
jgi:hypothetical protein